LANLILGIQISFMLLLSSLFLGAPIGAGIGFKAGAELPIKNQVQILTKVLLTNTVMTKKMDSFIRTMDSLMGKIVMKRNKEQESESAVPRVTSTTPPHSSGTDGASTAPPRPSGTSGAAATSGSEKID
jgi:hypothetical protein